MTISAWPSGTKKRVTHPCVSPVLPGKILLKIKAPKSNPGPRAAAKHNESAEWSHLAV
jgi:hypothetical protein